MPIIHHTIPMVVATGATTRVAEKALPSRHRRVVVKRKPVKKRVPAHTVLKRKVHKAQPKLVTARRRLPPGKWVQLSREELVRLVGVVKADKVKASAGRGVRIGMYDTAIYVNGKYYLNIS